MAVEGRVYQVRPSTRKESVRQTQEEMRAEPTLGERIAFQAKLISAIERLIERNEAKAREYEQEYARIVGEFVAGYREQVRRHKERLIQAEEGMVELLALLPEGRRRYRHGWLTFGISPAKERVEFTDEEAALAEVKSLGEGRAKPLIDVEERLKKKELLAFIKRGDAPGFEHIKLLPGRDSLRRTRGK